MLTGDPGRPSLTDAPDKRILQNIMEVRKVVYGHCLAGVRAFATNTDY